MPPKPGRGFPKEADEFICQNYLSMTDAEIVPLLKSLFGYQTNIGNLAQHRSKVLGLQKGRGLPGGGRAPHKHYEVEV